MIKTTIVVKTTAAITIPAIAPAAADPHKLPSLGEVLQPEVEVNGRLGASVKGAAPREGT